MLLSTGKCKAFFGKENEKKQTLKQLMEVVDVDRDGKIGKYEFMNFIGKQDSAPMDRSFCGATESLHIINPGIVKALSANEGIVVTSSAFSTSDDFLEVRLKRSASLKIKIGLVSPALDPQAIDFEEGFDVERQRQFFVCNGTGETSFARPTLENDLPSESYLFDISQQQYQRGGRFLAPAITSSPVAQGDVIGLRLKDGKLFFL